MAFAVFHFPFLSSPSSNVLFNVYTTKLCIVSEFYGLLHVHRTNSVLLIRYCGHANTPMVISSALSSILISVGQQPNASWCALTRYIHTIICTQWHRNNDAVRCAYTYKFHLISIRLRITSARIDTDKTNMANGNWTMVESETGVRCTMASTKQNMLYVASRKIVCTK